MRPLEEVKAISAGPRTGERSSGLRLHAFDGIEHFKREVIAAGGEYADRIANQIIGNDSGNGGGESGGGGDEGFGDAWSDGAQGCAASSAESVESVNDAPDSAEQSDERSNGGGDGEPGNVALEARDFFGGADLHAALHRRQAAQGGGGRGDLALVFLEAAFEHSDERAGTELIGDSGDILQALSFAESPQEATTLYPGAPEQAPLSKDNGPGDETEGQQSDKDELGDGTCAGNKVKDFAAYEKCRIWEK